MQKKTVSLRTGLISAWLSSEKLCANLIKNETFLLKNDSFPTKKVNSDKDESSFGKDREPNL